MSSEREQFDDPAMRSLIRKAWAGEKAPGALRNRVLSKLDQTVAEGAAREVVGRISAPNRVLPLWKKLAVGSFFVLAVGYALMSYLDYVREDTPRAYVYTLPADIKQDMVKLHQSDPATLDRSAVAGATTDAEVSDRLSTAMGKKVLAPEMPGWIFTSAGMGKVQNQPAARLIYKKDNVTASVLSFIAPTTYTAGSGTMYDELLDQIAIAGIVKDGVIYCIIASPADAELLQMIRTLRNTFATKQLGLDLTICRAEAITQAPAAE